MSENNGELRDMFGHGCDLLVGMDHYVCGLVETCRNLCAKGSDTINASHEANLGRIYALGRRR